jgi:hypothetical protein
VLLEIINSNELIKLASWKAQIILCPAGVVVMEQRDWRDQLGDGVAYPSLAPCAVILNPSSSLCPTRSCDSLDNLVRNTQIFTQVHGASGSMLPAGMAFAPDVVVLRLTIDGDNQNLLATCRNARARTAILAVVCPGFSCGTGAFSTGLNAVDDFLSWPFQDPELHFRIQRIMGSKMAPAGLGDSCTVKTKPAHDFAVGASVSPIATAINNVP